MGTGAPAFAIFAVKGFLLANMESALQPRFNHQLDIDPKPPINNSCL